MSDWSLTHDADEDLSQEDVEMLAAALTDPFYSVTDLLDDRRRGLIAIYRGRFNGVPVGIMAVRIDGNVHGDELVIVAAGGETLSHAGSILVNLAPLSRQLATDLKCKSVRAHSRIGGVQRLMAHGGWREVERIFRLEAA